MLAKKVMAQVDGRNDTDLHSSAHETKNSMKNEQDDSDCSSWDGRSHSEAPQMTRGKPSFTFIENGIDDDEAWMPDPPEDIPEVILKPGRLIGMIFSCTRWSKSRFRATILGCISSIIVLTIRLLLDLRSTTYLIHSVVVFLDMVLIHLFTNKIWLSVAGELMTIAMFLAFHFTKETLWELLETTSLAVLCSCHLIKSRNIHMDNEKELQRDLNTLCRQTSHLLQHSTSGLTRQQSARHLERMASSAYNWNSDRTIEMEPAENDQIQDLEAPESVPVRKVKVWGEQFFEHFLDGSAGVMYTSFFGLIVDELIQYGESKGG